MSMESSAPVRSGSRRNTGNNTGSNPLNIRQEILRHHQPGRHCGSSAIRNLLDFHGVTFQGASLSEAMCLGLGCGLGITYLELPATDTPMLVHVRSLGFEAAVFAALGIPFAWEEFSVADDAAMALDAALQTGRPALLLTDIFHLPYFGSRTHFPGHAVLAWGRDADADPDKATMYVTDTERPDAMGVPVADLTRARFSALPPFPHRGSLFAPATVSPTVAVADAVRPAIRRNAEQLLAGTDRSGRTGIAALAHWRAELPRWRALDNWSWVTRFAYQVIERRGTGGGGFRGMYAEFLDEASLIDAEIIHRQLPALMRSSAAAWTNLAEGLRDASGMDALPTGKISALLLSVERTERAYLQEAVLL